MGVFIRKTCGVSFIIYAILFFIRAFISYDIMWQFQLFAIIGSILMSLGVMIVGKLYECED
jgi:ABC-type multidrug transport system permease subunit